MKKELLLWSGVIAPLQHVTESESVVEEIMERYKHNRVEACCTQEGWGIDSDPYVYGIYAKSN